MAGCCGWPHRNVVARVLVRLDIRVRDSQHAHACREACLDARAGRWGSGRGECGAVPEPPVRGCTHGESSTTRQRAGSTPRRRAARRKMSGAGLPRVSSGSSPQTTTRARRNSSGWASRFLATAPELDEVAMATGTWSATWSTTRWAPGSGSIERYRSSKLCSHSSTSCCGVSFESISKCSSTIRAQWVPLRPRIRRLSGQYVCPVASSKNCAAGKPLPESARKACNRAWRRDTRVNRGAARLTLAPNRPIARWTACVDTVSVSSRVPSKSNSTAAGGASDALAIPRNRPRSWGSEAVGSEGARVSHLLSLRISWTGYGRETDADLQVEGTGARAPRWTSFLRSLPSPGAGAQRALSAWMVPP